MFRLLFPAVVVVAFMSLPASYYAQNKTEAPKKASPNTIKWDLQELEKYLDGEFGVKIKSSSLVDIPDPKGKPTKGIKLLLEFTKDIDGKSAGNVRSFFQNFSTHAYFHLYDEENVVFGTVYRFQVDGVTGAKGDAFRVIAASESQIPWEKTKRVAARLATKKKPENKKKSS